MSPQSKVSLKKIPLPYKTRNLTISPSASRGSHDDDSNDHEYSFLARAAVVH